MAKRFGGFTPDQQQTLLSRMGYTGPAQQDDMNKFMMSSPKAASMMGKYAEAAKARVSGGPTVGMAEGGIVPWSGSEASGYEFGGTKYFSLAEAEQAQAASRANVTSSTPTPAIGTVPLDNMAMTQPVTTGAAPTSTYDPSTGLPTMPDSLKGITEAPTELSYNPADVVAGRPGGFFRRDKPSYIKLSDGTVFSTKEGSTGQEVEAVLKMAEDAVKERNLQIADWGDYDAKLGQYKSHQSTAAAEGLVDPMGSYKAAKSDLAQQQALLSQYTKQLAAMTPEDPQRAMMEKLIADQGTKITAAQEVVSRTQGAAESLGMPDTTELRATALADPSSLVTNAVVAKTTAEQAASGKMAVGTGDAGIADTAAQTLAAAAPEVATPIAKDAATFTAEESAQQVQDTLATLEAATGKPSEEALSEAQTFTPEQLAALNLDAVTIDAAQKVVAPEALTVQDDELITGSTVDMARVATETNFAAATGVPSSEATVQGQLTGLLEQFEGGETPAWAAGAMRAATAQLAARGLGASSMAGQAIVQAAMESALPIAQADAETRALFERDNLSNRQQAAYFAAEQRSKFLNLEFDQEFQSRVNNAARIADIANINFSAEQQIALENSRLAQSVDLANMSSLNAKVLADAAALTGVDMSNLNNRQQSAVQNAQSFLQMDMASLSNTQQAAIFKAQSNVQSILTDTAAANAAAQFNAVSENQTNQFYDNLVTQVSQFNAEQTSLLNRFNAGEANAISQFNTTQANLRDQFNASNSLVIEQANAVWAQAIATADNAAQNIANRDAALAATGMTETTYNNMLQQERDILDYAWRTVDNALGRQSSLTIAEMQTQAEIDKARGEGTGKLLNTALEFAMKLWE